MINTAIKIKAQIKLRLLLTDALFAPTGMRWFADEVAVLADISLLSIEPNPIWR